MSNYASITNAGLLILVVGYTLIGSIITIIIAARFVDRAKVRGYSAGYRHAEEYYTSR
jgi:hypothetical protein